MLCISSPQFIDQKPFIFPTSHTCPAAHSNHCSSLLRVQLVQILHVSVILQYLLWLAHFPQYNISWVCVIANSSFMSNIQLQINTASFTHSILDIEVISFSQLVGQFCMGYWHLHILQTDGFIFFGYITKTGIVNLWLWVFIIFSTVSVKGYSGTTLLHMLVNDHHWTFW